MLIFNNLYLVIVYKILCYNKRLINYSGYKKYYLNALNYNV